MQSMAAFIFYFFDRIIIFPLWPASSPYFTPCDDILLCGRLNENSYKTIHIEMANFTSLGSQFG